MEKSTGKAKAIRLLKVQEKCIASSCNRSIAEISRIIEKLDSGWEDLIGDELSYVMSISRGRQVLIETIKSLNQKPAEVKPKTDVPRFQLSSLFLGECFEYLAKDPNRNERLHLVTGTVSPDGTKVLSRMEKIDYNSQSAGYVSADLGKSTRKMVELSEKHGHLLLGLFHSHISSGRKATTPSGIDWSCMERLSQIGCDCLGGIFSLDGYVRFFFSTGKPFEIDVYGKGIEPVSDKPSAKIFRIKEGGQK